MRILFYSDNFYPEISGISDSIITLGRELIRRGHTVGFAVPKYSDADYRYAGLDPDDSKFLEGFEVYRIPSLRYGNSPSGQARMVVPLGWSLGFVRKFKPDIIHSQSPFGTGFEALFAAKLFNIPLIGTNHTIMSEFARIYGPKYLEHTADKFLFWYYRRCLATSVPSPSLAEKMSATGYKTALEVIPNPVSLAQFSPASPTEREALRKEFHLLGPTILFVGRLGKEKQIEPVIDAVARLEHIPFIKLVIAGSGPLEADLKKKVRDLNIPEKVVFTGFLDHAALSRWYKAADIFAIMCPIETQCLALMQAFSAGLPSVGVNKGAVGEHIKEGFGYTVPEGNDAALAGAIERIINDPEGAKAMGERVREYVRQFSEAAVADAWLRIYEQYAR